jgi:acyl carrier protein
MEFQLREVNKMAGIKGKAEEVFAKVKEIIIREARVDEASITPDATMNDLYADSATRMSIGDELDREFELGILDVDLAEDTTVQDIVDFIMEQLGES